MSAPFPTVPLNLLRSSTRAICMSSSTSDLIEEYPPLFSSALFLSAKNWPLATAKAGFVERLAIARGTDESQDHCNRG